MTQATPRRFPIRLDPRYSWFLRIFGVRPENAVVELGEMLDARFGWSRITTPVANCAQWSIEGPWLAVTALGVRRSIRHADVTFGGSAIGGVRIDFREPVRYFFFRTPAIYVTVEDLEGFGAALSARGVPGQDRRRIVTSGS